MEDLLFGRIAVPGARSSPEGRSGSPSMNSNFFRGCMARVIRAANQAHFNLDAVRQALQMVVRFPRHRVRLGSFPYRDPGKFPAFAAWNEG